MEQTADSQIRAVERTRLEHDDKIACRLGGVRRVGQAIFLDPVDAPVTMV